MQSYANIDTLSKMFIGRAGEYWVAAQLLRNGLNAMPLSVDSGVDLLAHCPNSNGDSRLYQFQVKTSASRIAQFTLEEAKFNSLWRDGINLIIVSWRDMSIPEAVVIPPRLIYMMTSGGFKAPEAPLRTQDGKVHFRIEFHSNGKIFIRNRHHEFTAMRNRFDLIEDITSDFTDIPNYAEWSSESGTLIRFSDKYMPKSIGF